jgi:DNA-binding CsgD family transcriptional regulator
MDMVSLQQNVFCGFIFIVYVWGFLSIFTWSAKIKSTEKKFIRTFGTIYLLFMILNGALVYTQELYPIVSQTIFLLVFLSLHLIPVFFLNLYLEKTHRTEKGDQDFESRLASFAETHEISKREKEVVRLICQGLSNQEISEALFISLQTVKDHTHRIFLKTGVRNRVQLTNMIR